MSDESTQKITDLQDPLPESNWFWRRVFVFVLMSFLMWRLWFVLDDLAATALLSPEKGIGALLVACRYLCLFAFFLMMFYLLAPSAEQVTKMFKTATLLKHGVQFASRTVNQPGRSETASTVGQPPQPEAPAIPGPDAPAAAEPAPQPPATKKETPILE